MSTKWRRRNVVSFLDRIGRRSFVSRCGLAASVAVIGILGCGGGRLPPGETGTLSGKLTRDGKPVAKGTSIVFFDDKTGAVATGVADDNGAYVAEMKGELKVIVGVYRVSVTPPNQTAGMSTEEAMKASIEGKLKSNDEVLKQIPVQYRSPENSKTVFEVKPGSNTYNLDMKDE